MKKRTVLFWLIGILLLAAAWYFLSPLFIDKVVEEEFPVNATKNEMQAMLLASGEFEDADSFHQGSGQAKLYTLENEAHLLRLENFEVTNGPDLYVYFTADPEDVEADFYNVGRLKGNQGNQNYEIPAEVDVSGYDYVVIWCRAFSVLFAAAELNES